MNIDSKKAARVVRAILSGDVDFSLPRKKRTSGIPLFLAGLGTGAALGILFAPGSGEETRKHIAERTQDGIDMAKTRSQELSRRAKETVGYRKESTPDAAAEAS
jgi:YtxH-like protein